MTSRFQRQPSRSSLSEIGGRCVAPQAELCAFDDFKEHCQGKPSMANLKALGKYRQEGKNYVVQDGDIIEFKFNSWIHCGVERLRRRDIPPWRPTDQSA